MRYRDAHQILLYWDDYPPEGEMLAMLAGIYTTWEPASRQKLTEADIEAEHRKSLEFRWKTAQALSPKQMVEAFNGGALGVGAVNIGYDGIFRDADGRQIPGSHKFPGM
jgi:hypothetical protein